MIYQTVALALLAGAAAERLYTEDAKAQKYMWEGFKREYGREYGTMDEETRRFTHFVQNLRIADDRNAAEAAAGGSATHGITKFFDLSQVEFQERYLGSDETMKSTKGREYAEVPAYTGTATSVDWTGKYTTPVKDQGYCGSCWAFSATEQIESDAMRTLGYSTALSPAQITQCDKTSYGCDGGWTEHAYNYVKNAGGLETNADYPYTTALYNGNTGTCAAVVSKEVIGVTSYTTISGETNMANYMLATGPLSVCIDASTWNSYTGGIVTSCGKNVNHCVQAVGVDTSSAWKVRNSWGTSWGEKGFIRLAYGKDMCHITSDPTYVKVFKK